MKYILRQLIILLAVPTLVSAQVPDFGSSVNIYDYFDSGDGIEGINVPYYDKDGELQAKLFGGYARLLDNEVVGVTNIRIDVYEKGEVVMTIFAPQCFTSLDENEGHRVLNIRSEGDVLIELEQMTIVGKGFRFSSNQNKFEILNDARVLVKESVREMDGVDL